MYNINDASNDKQLQNVLHHKSRNACTCKTPGKAPVIHIEQKEMVNMNY